MAENAVPGGLPYVPNPNAGSAETGAVTGGEVLPAISAATTKPAADVRINYAQLYPARVRAGRRVRADMLLSTAGDVRAVSVRVERRQRGRWRKLRSLRSRRVESGQTLLPQKLGRLRPGRHRLIVSVTDSLGPAARVTVPLPVRRG